MIVAGCMNNYEVPRINVAGEISGEVNLGLKIVPCNSSFERD